MKKFWFRFALYLGGMVGIAWLNYAVLMHFHPLEYYYTPAGILLTTVVCAAEYLIIGPIARCMLEDYVLPAMKEGLDEEKEAIITEFKED